MSGRLHIDEEKYQKYAAARDKHEAEREKVSLGIVRLLAENNIRLSEMDGIWNGCKRLMCARYEEELKPDYYVRDEEDQ